MEEQGAWTSNEGQELELEDAGELAEEILKLDDTVLLPETEGADPVLDLNTATVEELETLPGIGQVLAQRIVDHRTNVKDFEELSEIVAVRGISQAMYERMADRLTVGSYAVERAADDMSFPEPLPILPLEPEAEESAEPEGAPPPPPSVEETEVSRVRAEGEPPLVQVVRGPAGWWRMLLVGLLSAIAGALLALVFLFIVNGTLDFQAATERTIRAEVEQLESDLQSLGGELGQVEARLAMLDEVSTRLESAQADIAQLGGDLELAQSRLQSTSDLVGTLRQEFTNMREDMDGMAGLVSSLGQRADDAEAQLRTLGRKVEAMSGSVERFDLFVNGLRNLLNRLLEEQNPTATPWVTVTPNPEVTVIPQATPTPSGQ